MAQPCKRSSGFFLHVLLLVFLLSQHSFSQDWPQWRGPTRTGGAPKSPALAETWPRSGPKQLWKSETIPNGEFGGYGNVSVADGRVYLFVNWKIRTPGKKRVISGAVLKKLGWSAKKLPAELARKVEAIRLSDEGPNGKGRNSAPGPRNGSRAISPRTSERNTARSSGLG